MPRPYRARVVNEGRSSGCFGPLAIGCGVAVAAVVLSCVGLGMFGVVLGKRAEEAAKKDLTEANRLWDRGDHAGAVPKYKSVLDRNWPSVPSEQEKPAVYQRVIGHELEQGRADVARTYAERALDNKVELLPGNDRVTELAAGIRAERAKRAVEEQAQRAAEAKRREEQRVAEARRDQEKASAEAKRKQQEQEERDRVLGKWKCVSEIASGEPLRPAYHKTWTIEGDRVKINGDDDGYWYALDTSASPHRMQVYNQVGARRVNVYACIYKFEDGKLIICFEPGDSFPSDFRAGPRDSSFMLTFTK